MPNKPNAPAPLEHYTVIIPARLASTRLPDKPLADIGGLPMVVRVARQAQQSLAHQVVVATDAERVVAACANHGIVALRTRSDHASGSDRLAEAAQILGLADTALVLNVQGDEPFIDPQLIDQLARFAATHADTPMCTVAHPITALADFHSPHVVKVVCNAEQHALYFSRAPIPWPRDAANPALPEPAPLRHIGIYSYRAGFLRTLSQLPASDLERTEALEQLRVLSHGHAIGVAITPTTPLPGVDTPADLERARAFCLQA